MLEGENHLRTRVHEQLNHPGVRCYERVGGMAGSKLKGRDGEDEVDGKGNVEDGLGR